MSNDEIILKKLNEISSELSSIKKRMSNMESCIKQIHTSNDRMDNHISFIEVVYDKLRHPLNAIMTMGGEKLPEIELSEELSE